MPNYLDSLIDRIDDEGLASALRREVNRLRDEKTFGLVFERHLPERVRLYSHPIRQGLTVQKRDNQDDLIWTVVALDAGRCTIARSVGDEEVTETCESTSLVAIRDFGQPIYPGLRSLGTIQRGASKPSHVVLNAENYHALQLLLYTHSGRVDCVYIDPPYNSGARDWKYNNDYVDSTDLFRHSKWLSFMEKRLVLAKRLLNPAASALIVTIDEKEAHRLGLLLRQVFRGSSIQMVSSVINPKGVVRDNEFSRTDEYLFFVLIGGMRLQPEGELGSAGSLVPWQQFRRTDITSARGTVKGGKSQFYPIFVNRSTHEVEDVGDPLPPDVPRESVPAREGCATVFPVRDDGTEMNWGLTPSSAKALLANGFLKATKLNESKPQPFPIKYLTRGRIKDIDEARAEVVGYEPSGAAIARYRPDASK
jgi:adenine-specific DNA-methyltransferase